MAPVSPLPCCLLPVAPKRILAVDAPTRPPVRSTCPLRNLQTRSLLVQRSRCGMLHVTSASPTHPHPQLPPHHPTADEEPVDPEITLDARDENGTMQSAEGMAAVILQVAGCRPWRAAGLCQAWPGRATRRLHNPFTHAAGAHTASDTTCPAAAKSCRSWRRGDTWALQQWRQTAASRAVARQRPAARRQPLELGCCWAAAERPPINACRLRLQMCLLLFIPVTLLSKRALAATVTGSRRWAASYVGPPPSVAAACSGHCTIPPQAVKRPPRAANGLLDGLNATAAPAGGREDICKANDICMIHVFIFMLACLGRSRCTDMLKAGVPSSSVNSLSNPTLVTQFNKEAIPQAPEVLPMTPLKD